MSNDKKMTEAEMMAELVRLRTVNAQLKQGLMPDRKITFKVSEKGAVSVYGLGRFPVTLYKRQWERLIGRLDELKAFLSGVSDDISVAPKATEYNPETGEIIQDKKSA